MAFVVPRPGSTPTSDELIAWCRDTMANFKAPRYVEIVDALPLNATREAPTEEMKKTATPGKAKCEAVAELLNIPLEFQLPFEVTHASMRALRLARDQPIHERAANLRRAFSGIVAGNIKEYGINAIERFGPFELAGEPSIMEPLDQLLRSFVAQRRMKFTGTEYTPCYRLVA